MQNLNNFGLASRLGVAVIPDPNDLSLAAIPLGLGGVGFRSGSHTRPKRLGSGMTAMKTQAP